jgi:hypothetical protein
MIRKQMKQASILFMLIILIAAFITGCAVKKEIWGNPDAGLILTYRMPENQVFQYRATSEESQTVEIMGQANSTKSTSGNKFSVKSKGLKDNNLILGITVNDIKLDITSMMGDISPDMKPIIGKEFEMTLSPLGKEIGFSGAESLKYNLGPSGDRNIESSFRTIFPDLSDLPVKIGDSWKSKDENTEKTGGISVTVTTESISTLQGLETVNGLECVKITTNTTGKVSGGGTQGGQDISFKGDIKGSSTWYFAYKAGVFVKLTSQSSSKGSVTVTAMNMDLPMTTESKTEISLVK